MGVTGNNILVGDNFSSGSGSDTFVFGNGDGTDTVLDFEVGIDQIGLVEGELVFRPDPDSGGFRHLTQCSQQRRSPGDTEQCSSVSTWSE